ncbi:DUF647-domain-containing protein [Cristinia sonorae]|uniref:DUF647-domain-containing protein n=1 Tax=Cristinia sonorae TaxID=1940300 RepID=A0A8K0UQ50_9AGAR|nr:DUF647-domain-containing protein [Cristinia sonorae]
MFRSVSLQRTFPRTRCSRPPSYPPLLLRYNSSNAPRPPSLVPDSSITKPRPFVVEHVDGREHHLSWSPEGGITKEWRDAGSELASREASGGTGNAISTAVSGTLGGLTAWFRQMFLPTNYPQSVHRSYAAYHILQIFENTLGTLVSVLCNQALLSSVGVSAEGSIFGAVAVQWIIKDGAGEFAKLFFIRKCSSYFDSHPKTINLLGETSVALGSGLQIASLLVSPSPANFLLCAAGGNIFKLVGNAIWFTTHIKFVRYFSRQGNTGDVAAKEESQASIGQLLGYSAGIGLLTLSHSPAYLYSIFFLAVPVSLGITTWMLKLATFELLTLPRLSVLSRGFVSGKEGGEREMKTLAEVDSEGSTGLFGEFYKRKHDKFLTLAPRVEDILTRNNAEVLTRWNTCADAFHNERYLLYPSSSRSRPHINIFFDPLATTDDMLRSILHAARLRHILLSTSQTTSHSRLPSLPPSMPGLDSALASTREWTNENFDEFKRKLDQCGWRTDEICFADHGRRVSWRRHT